MSRLRRLLFPIAGMYYLVTSTRNTLYNKGILKSKQYALPVICIGNLTVGGTGKSPMTEYLIRLLKDHYKLATLSRGYGRRTKGYFDVMPTSNAIKVGDEPLQFAQKFDDIQVAVCEDRQLGIETLLSKQNPPEVVVLDDAYQHRKINAGFYILLTAYNDLYSDDMLLPAGNLREPISGSKRASIVVVTKCPPDLSKEHQTHIERSLGLPQKQPLLFSTIVYDTQVYSVSGASQLNALKAHKITVVTGIANPQPLLNHLTKEGLTYHHKSYRDHHNFTAKEIEELDQLGYILTTEKDYVRLQPLLKEVKLFYLPIQIKFIDNSSTFDHKIIEYVKGASSYTI